MKECDFDNFWITFRAALLGMCIMVLILMQFGVFGRVVDIEGPSGEAMNLEREHRERENREAHERVMKNEERPGDEEKSVRYMLENYAHHVEKKEKD